MKNSKPALFGFLNALGVAVYVSGVALIIQNGEKIFGKMHNLLGPVSFLLLFVTSASITGSLVLGRPIWLFFENRKAEALKLFLYTVAWLFTLTLTALIIQIKL